MREGIGSVFLYNIIIIFILVTFAFLSGTVSYVKAFKANSRIVSALEKYEGYNVLSNDEINRSLNTLGYKLGSTTCPNREKTSAIAKINNGQSYEYCLYYFNKGNKNYYGVLTYMTIDLPGISAFRIPIYAKTEKIYPFS